MEIRNNLLAIVSLVALFGINSQINAATEGPGFQIQNKAKNSIKVTLVAGPMGTAKMYQVSRDMFLPVEINLQDRITIKVIDGSTSKMYTIDAPGKTKYLTWNPSKSKPLYPQTGTYMGLSGTSETGYSLKKNVSASDIK
jgi:hypothetical protein